MYIDYKFIL